MRLSTANLDELNSPSQIFFGIEGQKRKKRSVDDGDGDDDFGSNAFSELAAMFAPSSSSFGDPAARMEANLRNIVRDLEGRAAADA